MRDAVPGRVPRRKQLPRTQRLGSCLPKKHLVIGETFGQIFCGIMRTFLKGVRPVSSSAKLTAFYKKSTAVKHGGGSVGGRTFCTVNLQ